MEAKVISRQACIGLFLSLLFHCFAIADDGFAMSSDSALIYYRTFGSGKPLLIINGGPGMNSDGFEGLAKALSSGNLTIIYDQRGTGRSALPLLDSSTITMQLMIDDIEAIRTTLGIERLSILGHSFGGMLASYYAALHPEHLDHLILSSSGGIDLGLLKYAGTAINSKLSSEEKDSVHYWSDRIDAGDTSHYAQLERGRFLAPAYVYDKAYVPVIAERLTHGNATVNQLIWSDLQRIHFDCSEQLRTLDRPVLIIQGKQDIIRTETAERAHRVLKHSRVVFLEHSAHYGWLDNANAYFGEIRRFMESDGG
jgi:proline iminopeptidase